jgi:mono/diheme cytochrome c family protein
MSRSIASTGFLTMTLVIVAAVARAEDGKTVFEKQQCGLCHSVAAAGIQSKLAEGKGGGGELGGVVTAQNVEWAMRYLKKEADKDGKPHPKPFKDGDDELKLLVDWLAQQKGK